MTTIGVIFLLSDIFFYGGMAMVSVYAIVKGKNSIPFLGITMLLSWFSCLLIDLYGIGIPYTMMGLVHILSLALIAKKEDIGLVGILIMICYLFLGLADLYFWNEHNQVRLSYVRVVLFIGIIQMLLLSFNGRIKDMVWYDRASRALDDGRYSNILSRYWVHSNRWEDSFVDTGDEK